MKKHMKFLIGVVIVAIIAILLLKICAKQNTGYTLQDAMTFFDFKTTSNMKVTNETIYEDGREKFVVEVYIKDDDTYVKSTHNDENVMEFMFDYKNKIQKNIDYPNKQIQMFKFEDDAKPIELALQNITLEDINKDSKGNYEYEYLGNEMKDGKNYIKFSIIMNEEKYKDLEGKVKRYYYVDEQSRLISKIETYTIKDSEIKFESITNFTYSYDTVTDIDIPIFDVNKYSDYEIMEIK